MKTFRSELLLCLFLLLGLCAMAQEKNLIQIKAFDQKMNPMNTISVSINGKEFIPLDGKKATFHEFANDDLPPKSVKISNADWEAESWSYSKGILEIIVRKKTYSLADIKIITADKKPVANASLTFKGRKTLTETSNAQGDLQLPLALDEKITTQTQFAVAGYKITKMITSEKGKILVAELLPRKDLAPASLKNFDLAMLDSIRSLTVFYAVFKNYDMSVLDKATLAKIDAKFFELVGQVKKPNDQDAFFNKISDSSFVKNDVATLLEQARLENTLLDNFRNDFDEKIKIINQKLAGGTASLKPDDREKLLGDLTKLEDVLRQNEDKFYKNIADYRIILASLRSSFSDIQDLEKKLSASELKRLEEQQASRQKIIITASVALAFAILVIFLIGLRDRVEKQKRTLVKVNAEIKRINENLESLVFERSKKLVEAYQEMDIFLYRASHDLRSPICTIIGLCNIALHQSDDQTEMIHKIAATANKMDGMLKKLRMISEVNHPSNYSPVQMTEKVVSVIRTFKNNITTHNIDVRLDCQEDLKFSSYPDLIEIILYNLVENALFFSCMQADRRPSVLIKTWLEHDKLHFTVQDNGIGIEEHVRVRLWDMFFVGTEHSKGNGLGLYIVLKSVQSLNGKIDVQSEPQKLTQFSITIPVNTKVTSALSKLNAPKTQPKRIAVASGVS